MTPPLGSSGSSGFPHSEWPFFRFFSMYRSRRIAQAIKGTVIQ